MKIDPIK